RYDDKEYFLRKADVVNRSKDEFTASRNRSTSQLIPKAPNVLTVPGFIRVWVSKEGRTNLIAEDLSAQGDEAVGSTGTLGFEWKGKDTLSLHVERRKMTKRGLRWIHTEYPIGWGASYVNGEYECKEDEEGNEICPRYMQENRLAEWFADHQQREMDVTYNGIQAYYDLRNLSRENKDSRLALRIEVSLPQEEIRTASKIDGLGSDSVVVDDLRNGIGDGMFGTEDQMAGGGLAVIASGELYFHPPDDYNPAKRQGHYEIASLFNPYWEVHLIDTPMERVYMAWSLRDESLLPEGVSGVADGIEYFTNEKAEELEQLRQLQHSLQIQLNNPMDEVSRNQVQSQLDSVVTRISELDAMDFSTAFIAESFQQEMLKGFERASNVELGEYEQILQEYGTQQGMDLVNSFEDEMITQVTDQLQQVLERAAAEAVGGVMQLRL
ncbi:MAG: hypothetical protein AB2598_15940, partial [Candidatus Thiodiazotropha sp.]